MFPVSWSLWKFSLLIYSRIIQNIRPKSFFLLDNFLFQFFEFLFIDFIFNMEENIAEIGFFWEDIPDRLKLSLH